MLFFFTIACAAAYATQGILKIPNGNNDQIMIETMESQVNRVQLDNDQPEYLPFRLAWRKSSGSILVLQRAQHLHSTLKYNETTFWMNITVTTPKIMTLHEYTLTSSLEDLIARAIDCNAAIIH